VFVYGISWTQYIERFCIRDECACDKSEGFFFVFLCVSVR